ncbi:MAG: glycosyltransferase [Planctomycetes bacterium]|nr:glycosyltransferase [Planctomycetota bacterium]
MIPGKSSSLLFVTPDPPTPGGTGLGMRAWAVRERLAMHHDVSLLIASTVPRSPTERLRRMIRFKARGWYPGLFAEAWDWENPASRMSASSAALRGRADLVHAFRLAMAPCAAPHFSRVPCHLDLDESESRTRARIGALARRNGERGLAEVLEAEAAFYRAKEREWLPRFDRIYAASALEVAALRAELPASDIRVLPNVVSLPAEAPRPYRCGPFTLLFVGSLGYYPNHDAVRYFVRAILPMWRSRPGRDLRVVVVGSGADRGLRRLMAAEPMIEYRGYVDDLTPIYRAADIAIVPLRAGGGTRIKILEAFAHGLPVVATSEGAEGLDVVDGQHILIGHSPEAFANACMRLMEESDLARRLAAAARGFVAAQHTPDMLDALD